MQSSPYQPTAITVPRAFRRGTGAHGIIAQLVLADLIGFVVWVLIGAFIGPPLWYVVRALLDLLHASLLFDFWLILTIVCLATGRYRQRSLHKAADDAWGGASLVIILSGAAIAVIWLAHSAWMRIPAGAIPAVPLEPITSWKLVLVPQGAAIAAGVSGLSHLLVVRHAHDDPDDELRTFSRAHPEGPIWQLIEQCYSLYRQDLDRFHPSPIRWLKTPPTFFYYQRQTTPESPEPANPEQELYWRDGNLVIHRAYIGPKEEQTDILLPLLARLLYDCNTPSLLVERLFHLTHVAERSWLTAWPLTVLLYISQGCEQQWRAMERERVLERDWFANALGQGPRLRKWLRLQLQDRTENSVLDTTIPTLAERIDHLDSLLAREKRQVERLRHILPSPPQTEA